MTQRAAIYARYSSDSQREASIDDQIRLCREFVGRHDWTLVEIFTMLPAAGLLASAQVIRL